MYSINTEEIKRQNLSDYESINDFFTRHLKDGVRTIDELENPKFVCSPCDGTVFNLGTCAEDTFVIVKGHTYKIDEFLFGFYEDSQHFKKILNVVKERNNELKYILLYLSPKDYHRYHSAAICSKNYRRHIPGSLYPVMPSFVNNRKPNTFNANERVVLFGEWIHGFFSTTFIGATNVGSIVLNFDKELSTNSLHFVQASHYDKNYLQMTELDGIFKNNLIIKKQFQGENEEDVIDIRNELSFMDIRDIIDIDSKAGRHLM